MLDSSSYTESGKLLSIQEASNRQSQSAFVSTTLQAWLSGFYTYYPRWRACIRRQRIEIVDPDVSASSLGPEELEVTDLKTFLSATAPGFDTSVIDNRMRELGTDSLLYRSRPREKLIR